MTVRLSIYKCLPVRSLSKAIGTSQLTYNNVTVFESKGSGVLGEFVKALRDHKAAGENRYLVFHDVADHSGLSRIRDLIQGNVIVTSGNKTSVDYHIWSTANNNRLAPTIRPGTFTQDVRITGYAESWEYK
jgi:hypothetical protein